MLAWNVDKMQPEHSGSLNKKLPLTLWKTTQKP